jgi:hypothetical protein
MLTFPTCDTDTSGFNLKTQATLILPKSRCDSRLHAWGVVLSGCVEITSGSIVAISGLWHGSLIAQGRRYGQYILRPGHRSGDSGSMGTIRRIRIRVVLLRLILRVIHF